MLHRHETGTTDVNVLARRRRPHQIALEHAVAHVEHPLVLEHPSGREEERLVVPLSGGILSLHRFGM